MPTSYREQVKDRQLKEVFRNGVEASEHGFIRWLVGGDGEEARKVLRKVLMEVENDGSS